ncbi:hypothetical protein MMC32_002830 [Xylographa parallela]|nr:hypothetical protein [Xylographa parallela]
MTSTTSSHFEPLPLPPTVSERYITCNASDLSYHILEAGVKGQPLILLAHGFPELAYSWRKCMPGLAKAGYYTVAVDQRGYGRTTGWDASTFDDVDLATFSVTNLVRDMVVLVHALGYRQVDCIVGHDFGSVTASLCALTRPDFFHKVVLISHPFKGTPVLPFNVSTKTESPPKRDIRDDLASLPSPRKHYKWYYSTREANSDMAASDGLREFLRGYFYLKSADWTGNNPRPLKAWTAEDLAQMPLYYIMPLGSGMRESVRKELDSGIDKSQRWLSETELDV